MSYRKNVFLRCSMGNVEAMLRSVDMHEILFHSKVKPPKSPLAECLRLEPSSSPTIIHSPSLSIASEESMDSILALPPAVCGHDVPPMSPCPPGELEMRQLIYKLCRSLYKKAIQKIGGGQVRHSSAVPVDSKYETNMSHMSDWMPLLHLFEPNRYYEMLEKPYMSMVAMEFPSTQHANHTSAKSPTEALQLFMDELIVEKLSGGNSNHVYQLGHPHYPGRSILVRLYGNVSGEVIDRYRDVMASKQMSDAKLSPVVLHYFKWGRVEEFMDDVATGSTDLLFESPTLLSEVFMGMSVMHKLPVEPFLPENANVAWFAKNGQPKCLEHLQYIGSEDYLTKSVSIISKKLREAQCNKYYKSNTEYKILEEVCPSSFERASLRYLRLISVSIKDEYCESFVDFICHEILRVREVFLKKSIPLTFSHNDLNPWNILISWKKVTAKFRKSNVSISEDDEVTSILSDQSSLLSRKFLTKKGHHKNLVDLKGLLFIDFEYSDVNYRCFDLGNTICELDYDYTRGMEDGGPGFIKYLYTFPPPAYELQWKDLPIEYPRMAEVIYDTWKHFSMHDDSKDTPGFAYGEHYLNAIAAYYHDQNPAADATHVSLTQLGEVFLGMLASHLYWSLWSFVMACNSDSLTNNVDDGLFSRGSSGLDYLKYGNCRLKEYFALKSWLEKHDFL
ncbi:unnamed protein product [Phytomonas sp. EM1]|nr:unnamed protein product [Phytomonas sp. EM1]|eukprot:CCW65851.1 unnamed protein product [Phytomonas sp. isolate EM1]